MLDLVSKFSCDGSIFMCHYFIVQLPSVGSALEPVSGSGKRFGIFICHLSSSENI